MNFLIDKPIGVFVSGGVDSALLLYMLLTQSSQLVHVLNISYDIRNYNECNSAIQITNKCIDLTKNDNVIYHTLYAKRSKTKRTDFFNIAKITNVTDVYSGHSKGPPIEIQESWGLEVKRTTIKSTPLLNTPFIDLDKRSIYQLYKKYDLLDNLYPLTNSCASRTSVTPCGLCWWCKERKWAENSIS